MSVGLASLSVKGGEDDEWAKFCFYCFCDSGVVVFVASLGYWPSAVSGYGCCFPLGGAVMKQFDVALWRWWPSLWPEWTGTVWAENAYTAIVQVMQVYGLQKVHAAAANARDGSIQYRCFRVYGVNRGLIWFTGRSFDSERKKVL
jgi:hypothetical protein